jgi:hypothetical protein
MTTSVTNAEFGMRTDTVGTLVVRIPDSAFHQQPHLIPSR